MGLRDLYNKYVRKSDYEKEMSDQIRIEKRVNEKQLGADERELNRFLEEARQKEIKKQLAAFRQQKQDEVWHGNTALDAPNVIASQKNLFTGQKNMFGIKSNNLKQQNMGFWK